MTFSPLQELLALSALVFVALAMFMISAYALVCHARGRDGCFKRWRAVKWLLSGALIVANMMGLAWVILAMGMDHTGAVDDGALLTAILVGLAPIALLVWWAAGSRIASAIVAVVTIGALGYVATGGAVHVLTLAAENGAVFAQVQLAKRYGQSNWWFKAAEHGHAEAEYQVGIQMAAVRKYDAARQWFIQAAEQGHPGATMQLVRYAVADAQKDYWLQRALALDVPDALFIQAKRLALSDPEAARELLTDAAASGSVQAIETLVREYSAGGHLYEPDAAKADYWVDQWRAATRKSRPADVMPPMLADRDIERLRGMGALFDAGDPQALFERANKLLAQNSPDPIARNRAHQYLQRAADGGHVQAALQIANAYDLATGDADERSEGIRRYEYAAELGSVRAMEVLARYYRGTDIDYQPDLAKAHEYSGRIVQVLAAKTGDRARRDQRMWLAFQQEAEALMARDKARGGSMQQLARAADQSPHAKFVYGEARMRHNYQEGMSLIRQSAAQGDLEATFYLARKTLFQPRAFNDETEALTALQGLAAAGYAPACMMLATRLANPGGMLPASHYLAGRFLRVAMADPATQQAAARQQERLMPEIADLQLTDSEDPIAEIDAWYASHRETTADPGRLATEYRNLINHFRDTASLGARASGGDADAQYALSQSLLNHDYAQAIHWLEQAARQGSVDAQYELFLRIIRGKKNPPAQVGEALRYLESAAEQQHVGAMAALAGQYRRGYPGVLKPDSGKAASYYQRVLDVMQGSSWPLPYFNGTQGHMRRAFIEKQLAAAKDA